MFQMTGEAWDLLSKKNHRNGFLKFDNSDYQTVPRLSNFREIIKLSSPPPSRFPKWRLINYLRWRPHGDSNPGSHRERVVS